ncbi:MAG: hypothetical protein FWE08_05500 [Oscillospiraceae bacterium]|nr:hypothetical protein [Oscillospiraceae bacterium]
MYNVAILEPERGKIATLLQNRLAERGGPSVTLIRGGHLHAFSGAYDLFVAASPTEEGGAASPALSCRALLTCAETPIIPSQWVVDYGLSVRDSLTVSSLEPNHAVLALQRELVTLDGTVIEQQELPLPIPSGTSVQGVMALYGSLLILGVPPEELTGGTH